MGRLIFVTGGARSGKSTFAEKLASQFEDSVSYIATSLPFDDEMKRRIEFHRRQRPSAWKTYEQYKDLNRIILESHTQGILLDCITIMITNLMMEEDLDWDNICFEDLQRVEDKISCEIEKVITAARQSQGQVIVVSNELGMGLVPEYPLGRAFRDIAGRMNQKLARSADEVYFVVSGIPMRLK